MRRVEEMPEIASNGSSIRGVDIGIINVLVGGGKSDVMEFLNEDSNSES